MSEINGYAEMHDRLALHLQATVDDPVAQVAGTVALAASDSAEGWTGLARDLERVIPMAAGGDRLALTRAMARCESLAKTARKIERDVSQVTTD